MTKDKLTLEEELLKKLDQKDKRGKRKMKVSGKNVLKLKKVIINKTKG